MTVIAWRNGIMACDSCWSYGSTQVASAIKIKRLSSGALLGSAGDNDSRAMEVLLDKIKDPSKLPTREQLAATKCDFLGLLALPRGGVYVISSSPTNEAGWTSREDDDDAESGVWLATTMGGYAAIGGGADFALAAMAAKATAAQAVEITCRFAMDCRVPVHVRRLVEPPAKKKIKKAAR